MSNEGRTMDVVVDDLVSLVKQEKQLREDYFVLEENLKKTDEAINANTLACTNLRRERARLQNELMTLIESKAS